MIKLIKNRSKSLIDKKVFKDINELNFHIGVIEKAETDLKDDIRTLELKNWLNHIKND
jgi:hypothetical protein